MSKLDDIFPEFDDDKVKHVKPTLKDMKDIYNDLINNPIKLDEYSKNLGDLLFWGRRLKGLSQQELADMLNIKQNTLSRYETNTRQMPFELFVKAMKIIGLKMTIDIDDSNDKKDRD